MSETKPAQHSVTFLKTDSAGNVNPNTPLRTFLARDGIYSNQSMGVWIVEDVAWKIFQERDAKDRLDSAIRTADLAGLPLPGRLRTEFGNVHKLDEPRLFWGFALVGKAIKGIAFSQKKRAAFKQTINEINDDAILEKIEKACQVAVNIRLRDPQGKINVEDNQNPIIFLDINIGTASENAQQLLDDVQARRATLPQHDINISPRALTKSMLRSLLLDIAPISLLTPNVHIPGLPDTPTHALLDPDSLTLEDPLVQFGLIVFFGKLASNNIIRNTIFEAIGIAAASG